MFPDSVRGNTPEIRLTVEPNACLLRLVQAQIVSHQTERNHRDPCPCKNEYEIEEPLNAHGILTCIRSAEKRCEKKKSSDRAENSPRHLSQGRKRANKHETGSHESGETRTPEGQVHGAVKGHIRW
jgi:hypothetical protein